MAVSVASRAECGLALFAATVFGDAPQAADMEREIVSVTGMSCGGCERNVENALRTLDGVNRVEADHEADTVEVVVGADVGEADVRAAIEDAGYEVTA